MDDAQTEIEQSIAETEQLVKDIYALPDEEIVLDEQPLYDELSQLLAIENPDEASAHLKIAAKTVETAVDTVLSNSFGFGGTNSALVLKKIEK